MLTPIATTIAQQPVDTSTALAPPGLVFRTMGSLILVVVLLLGCNLLFKRKLGSFARSAGPRRLRVVERLSIGHRHSLVLVDVGDKQLVLGVTPDRITTLDTSSHACTSFSAELSQATQAAEIEAS
jgi:flagellar biosynthetic protein FliO